MKQLIIITTAIVGLVCMQSFADVTNTVVVPLTWVGRSTEVTGSVPKGSSIGSAVSAGLALPLNPNQAVFDNGAYHMFDHTPPAGVQYASWTQYGAPFSSWECRHFQASFTLPVGLHNVVGFIVLSPYYTQYGNLIPINDNAYFYLNGTSLGPKGVDYGAGHGDIIMYETDGWHADGNFGLAPVASLQVGLNVLDIVTEERSGGGGFGLINVALLDVVPEPNTLCLVIGAIPVLIYFVRQRSV